jgi:hypothetical protein
VAITVVAALSLQFGRWIEAIGSSAAYVGLRENGLQLAAELTSWLAPFVHLVPSFPARWAPITIEVPHLGGPLSGWAGLAAAALALGVVGNALLLRSPNGAPTAAGTRGVGRHGSAGSPPGGGAHAG